MEWVVRFSCTCVVVLHAAGMGAPLAGQAGDTLILDLDQSLGIVLRTSFSMRVVSFDVERDEMNARAVRAGLKSNASLEITSPLYDQSISEQFNPNTEQFELFSTSRARWNAELRIAQPLPTNGEVSLNFELLRQLEQPFDWANGEYNSRAFLSFRQPIFRPNDLQIGIRRADLRLERTQLIYTARRIGVLTAASLGFYEFVEATYDVRLKEEAVARAQRSYEAAQRQFAAAEIRELDLLRLEVDLTQRQEELTGARGELIRVARSFSQFLSLPSERPIAVRADLEYGPVLVDVDSAVRRGVEQRVELQRREIALEQSELDVLRQRGRNKFQGEIEVTYGLDQRDSAIAVFVSRPDQARGISVSFSVPLWDWGQRGAFIQAAQIEVEKRELELREMRRSVEREVRNHVAEVEETSERLAILERSVSAARRSFELSFSEFEENRLGSEGLSLAERRLREAQASYLDAYTDYKRALVRLARATYWDYERNRAIAETG